MTYLSDILVPCLVGLDPDPFADMLGHRMVIEGKVIGGEIGSKTMAVVDN